jgi:hypothetical protein
MEAQKETAKPARTVRENNLFFREIIKRSSARLREYKFLSRIAS